MTALVAQGIRKSFGRREVLAGLDLEIMAGEMVAVVGENGSGKTTLLRILASDLRPDEGSVVIQGRPGYCPRQLCSTTRSPWISTFVTSRLRTGSDH